MTNTVQEVLKGWDDIRKRLGVAISSMALDEFESILHNRGNILLYL